MVVLKTTREGDLSRVRREAEPKEWFDLVVIVPLEEELQSFLTVFPGTTNRSTERTFRYEVDTQRDDVRMLVVQQEGMGKTHAGRAVSETLLEFDAGVVVCLGIAGSLDSDLRLGDICYSKSIADVLENARASDNDAGQLDLALSLTYFSTPREIVAAFNFCRTLPELKNIYRNWQEKQYAIAKSLDLTVPDSSQEHLTSVDGLIVCGAVTRSENYNNKLRGIDRKVLAVETESGGIFEEATRRSIPAVTIRGISDHADADKTRLEKQTGGAVRKLAALNASSFLLMQLSNTYFLKYLDHRRSATKDVVPLEIPATPGNDRDLATVIGTIGQYIDEQLRELSPDFKLQQKGYRLPTPRMRQVDLGGSVHSRSDPIEIRDALQSRSYALLNIARSYPDSSLSWVLANDLLTSELNGKQVIPIVVDGEKVAPPRSDFRSLAGYDFDDLVDREGVQLVFIVDELPLKSRSRSRYLEAQIKSFPTAKFVFITRHESVVISESEFTTAIAADVFQLSGISFFEISHFVQKNFGMTGSEAEVIALRLRETFRSFDLSAHPTYFAGIPREILSALLQANRRAELIQLAVDGFLTFVVAGDTADITLSRTTRLRFLRKLAVELNVEKHQFRQSEIVAFTEAFSAQFDFGIKPLAFVHSFIDAGILHFDGDFIQFSLPFIESYVLASELATDHLTAARYFVAGPDFDLNTFDLYAEIGASDQIIASIIGGLERSVQDFGLPEGELHILLSDKVRPSMMARPEQVDAMQKRLRKTAEDIEHGRGDTAKKQHFLDVADRIREEVADQSKPDEDDPQSKDDDRVTETIQNWLVATSLLGAGAEHLTADVKQKLARLLIEVAAIISHHATKAVLNVDFSDIKARLKTDPDVRDNFKGGSEDKDDEAVDRLIDGLVDVLEYSILSAAVRRVLQQLCEGARQRVLATSVEKARVTGAIESIIHGAWLADIESKRGRDVLVAAIKKLPALPFLRSLLAAHFVQRVYWNHWRKEDRLFLLSAAEETLKGLDLNINKAELQRYIENNISGDHANL